MKKVLYLSNIEVPYRVRFFNELAKYCDLMVLYESRTSQSRNAAWAKSEEKQYRVKYLKKELFGRHRERYDAVIIGCYHTPAQMLATLIMRLCRVPYIVNLDGEAFLSGNGFKAGCKRFFLSGAQRYLAAGEKAAESIKTVAGEKKVTPYYFSSLSEQEIREHREVRGQRNDTILVVGQYFRYKGMDVALETARMDLSLHYKFVGMGARTEQFLKEQKIPENVQIVPFLQKQELEYEYRSCAMLVLPSRQECWGLVVNEAASFGTPIVSTWGSGAAVEFLGDAYPQYLAKPGDPADLLRCIRGFLASEEKEAYCNFLLEKSREYSIERNVQAHLTAISEKRWRQNGFCNHSRIQWRGVFGGMPGKRAASNVPGSGDHRHR